MKTKDGVIINDSTVKKFLAVVGIEVGEDLIELLVKDICSHYDLYLPGTVVNSLNDSQETIKKLLKSIQDQNALIQSQADLIDRKEKSFDKLIESYTDLIKKQSKTIDELLQ